MSLISLIIEYHIFYELSFLFFWLFLLIFLMLGFVFIYSRHSFVEYVSYKYFSQSLIDPFILNTVFHRVEQRFIDSNSLIARMGIQKFSKV